MTYMDRTAEIVGATNEAMRLTENWVKSLQRGDSTALPEMIVAALKNMVVVASTGDIPEECQDLHMAILKAGEELRQYVLGFDGKVNPNGSPVAPFWAAVVNVQDVANRSEKQYREELESVKALREQKVSDDQIAFSIYGHRSKGPFVTQYGTVNKRLLDQAAVSEQAQEAILGKDWYPPWKENLQSHRQKEIGNRLNAFKLLAEGPKQGYDPATIDEMLLDGCYIQQIERGKGVTRDVILAHAAELGVEAKDTPGWTPKIAMRLPQPHVPENMQQPEGADQQANLQSSMMDDVAIGMTRDAIIGCATGNPKYGPAEIVAELLQDNIVVTNRQVSAILKTMKQQKKSA